jgi:chaperonin GroES
MPIRPLYDRVLVRTTAQSSTTESGLVIPVGAAGRPDQGLVVSAGEGHFLTDGTIRSLSIKVGDTVLFAPRSGQQVTVDGEEMLIFHESEIIGVVL